MGLINRGNSNSPQEEEEEEKEEVCVCAHMTGFIEGVGLCNIKKGGATVRRHQWGQVQGDIQ